MLATQWLSALAGPSLVIIAGWVMVTAIIAIVILIVAGKAIRKAREEDLPLVLDKLGQILLALALLLPRNPSGSSSRRNRPEDSAGPAADPTLDAGQPYQLEVLSSPIPPELPSGDAS